jgi:hypothetical protein
MSVTFVMLGRIRSSREQAKGQAHLMRFMCLGSYTQNRLTERCLGLYYLMGWRIGARIIQANVPAIECDMVFIRAGLLETMTS